MGIIVELEYRYTLERNAKITSHCSSST